VAPVGHLEHVRHVVADEHDRQAGPFHVEDLLHHAADSLTPRVAVGVNQSLGRQVA
jgi:hypothetical protein